MADRGESCRVLEDGKEITVALRPSAVTEGLNGRLSPEDITAGSNMVFRQLNLNSVVNSLYRGCHDINCSVKNNSMFRGIPNGDMDARIMFINKKPTQYEACNMYTYCDKCGIYLSLILSKMNIKRSQIYCTDMIKCNADPDEESCKQCIMAYLNKEILMVCPEIIICDGISVLNACFKMGVFSDGIDTKREYGTIYNVSAMGKQIKAMAMYDLPRVLSKDPTDPSYAECKNHLYMQLKGAINAIGGV